MAVKTEPPQNDARLVTSRTPVGPDDEKVAKSAGERAVMDAVLIVCGAWAVLFFLTFSLRSHNI